MVVRASRSRTRGNPLLDRVHDPKEREPVVQHAVRLVRLDVAECLTHEHRKRKRTVLFDGSRKHWRARRKALHALAHEDDVRGPHHRAGAAAGPEKLAVCEAARFRAHCVRRRHNLHAGRGRWGRGAQSVVTKAAGGGIWME